MMNTRDGNRRQANLWRSSRQWLAGFAAAIPAVVLAADIIGTSGPDFLEGTVEADKIDGKGDADTMMGLPGNDSYIVNQSDDEVIEAVGDGTDTVRSTATYTLPINVENLTLNGDDPINATGNTLNNRLTGNAANNTLNGRAGADRMFGLDGDDTYIVDSSGDVVVEVEGGGVDKVNSSVTHTLRVHVEKLVLTGSAAVNGTGNDLANSLTGNAANNTLRGMAGNDSLNGAGGDDVLNGGPGSDRLTGGTGLDTYRFDEPLDPATNLDRVTDFSPADDVMRLIGAVFPALTTEGTLPASAFALGTSAGDTADRIVYDQATGILRYDADGTGPTAPVRFATLSNKPAVTNADFVVVDPVVAPVDYAAEIQPIFNANCTRCHVGGSAPHGLQLTEGESFSRLVNVNSREVPSLKRVKPGDPDNSYLIQKVEGTAAVGGRMPLGTTALSPETIALMRRWISEGANP